MKGKYRITVGNNFLQYKFEIKRNITIIKGDSATGKTTLIDMIREYYENGEQSGVTLQCDKQCVVLEGRQWQIILNETHDSIIFIDEGNKFVASNDFAEAVKNTDNYFVIVTRESLSALPYSVNEIYGIKSSGKYGTLSKTYQEFYNIYTELEYNEYFLPETLIIEDSNSGYEFFNNAVGDRIKVLSAQGKSNIYKIISAKKDEKILVIADGAAFGPEMEKVMKTISSQNNTVIYLPESFEWIILKSNIIKDKEIASILENPSKYIDSKEYMSWEKYFTAVLIAKTNNTYLKYDKSKFNPAYNDEKIMKKVLDIIPKEIL